MFYCRFVQLDVLKYKPVASAECVTGACDDHSGAPTLRYILNNTTQNAKRFQSPRVVIPQGIII